ncbi:hypothetical protein [Endozoicomonas ascidiicola]|uniref:hypothetical protein n=1 Tax=Endozoicomonas ascidiicola TaxID=1698521 RepID=UPI000A504DF3|nr:hypothetical protein [Endozoicomonas ascidiicola]
MTPELLSQLSFYLSNPGLIPQINYSEIPPFLCAVLLHVSSNINGGWFAWEKIKECIDLIPYLQGKESERLKKKEIYMNIFRVLFNFLIMRSIGSKPFVIETANCPEQPKGICPCATPAKEMPLEYPTKYRGKIPVEIPRETVVSSCWLVSDTLCHWWRVLTDGFGVTSG